jgi:glutathione S-transferase
LITESDVILMNLEAVFGCVGAKMNEPKVKALRKLERQLFQVWWGWLCYPSRNAREENQKQKNFIRVAQRVDKTLGSTPGPFFLAEFSIADIVFVPFLERMSASLFYYKGFQLRDSVKFPHISDWFDALETRETYIGTQSDFHTHCHDLPPQMGGCYKSGDEHQISCEKRVDSGTDLKLPDCGYMEPDDSRHVALNKVIRHWEQMLAVNPVKNMDESLRAALTYMMTDKLEPITKGTEVGLRYIRDRISVPRDMPIWSARRFRQALEVVASTVSLNQGPPIPVKHRRDQNPKPFKRQKEFKEEDDLKNVYC